MPGPGGGYQSGRNRSASTSRFAMVPGEGIPRSAFDVQHTHKTTFDAGYLVPVYVDEVLPGDTHRVKMTAFARAATPLVPIMDNLIMESFFFFVPNRLVWEHWARFMGEKLNPADSTQFMVPQTSFGATVLGSLEDYFGIYQPGGGDTIEVNSLPFRGYNLIWNEWFRDEDLQNPAVVDVDDGPDNPADYVLLRRGKRHDYFTSCRPWPQKPMDTGVVSGIAPFPANFVPGGNFTWQNRFNIGAPVTGIGSQSAPTAGPLPGVIMPGNRTITFDTYHSTGTSDLITDSSGSGVPQIRVLSNDLRTALILQKIMEKNSRGGTRYTEFVWNHFRVQSPDARLQRPEYLGGGRSMVTINPVAQTSATGVAGTTTVLGELAGVGTAVAHGHGFSQSFTEHGFIIGLVNIRADMSYQQGVARMWYRRTQFDHYLPGTAGLGEQAVFQKEIFAIGDPAFDDLVFGYQERWAEYKYKPNRISGGFRSQSPTPLDMWHLGQFYVPAPVLNAAFIVEDPPVDRVLQVNTTDSFQFLFDSFFDCRMVRAMPMYSIPGVGARL